MQPVVKTIIPTKPKIAATQANSERKEKSEEKDTSPIVHSITRYRLRSQCNSNQFAFSAPKNYGNSLMNEEVKKSRDVPLPSHYEDLYKAFNACETVCFNEFRNMNKYCSDCLSLRFLGENVDFLCTLAGCEEID